MSLDPQDAHIGVTVDADQGIEKLKELKQYAEQADQQLQKLEQAAIKVANTISSQMHSVSGKDNAYTITTYEDAAKLAKGFGPQAPELAQAVAAVQERQNQLGAAITSFAQANPQALQQQNITAEAVYQALVKFHSASGGTAAALFAAPTPQPQTPVPGSTPPSSAPPPASPPSNQTDAWEKFADTFSRRWAATAATVGPVSEAGTLEAYIDCDGTAGAIYADDVTVTLTGGAQPSTVTLDTLSRGLPVTAMCNAAGGMLRMGLTGGIYG